MNTCTSVAYTQLDVYKRQALLRRCPIQLCRFFGVLGGSPAKFAAHAQIALAPGIALLRRPFIPFDRLLPVLRNDASGFLKIP